MERIRGGAEIVGVSSDRWPAPLGDGGIFLSGTFGRSDESLPHSDGDSRGTMMCRAPYQRPRQEDPSISQRGYAKFVSIAEFFDEVSAVNSTWA